jgi:hypothetical protein
VTTRIADTWLPEKNVWLILILFLGTFGLRTKLVLGLMTLHSNILMAVLVVDMGVEEPVGPTM